MRNGCRLLTHCVEQVHARLPASSPLPRRLTALPWTHRTRSHWLPSLNALAAYKRPCLKAFFIAHEQARRSAYQVEQMLWMVSLTTSSTSFAKGLNATAEVVLLLFFASAADVVCRALCQHKCCLAAGNGMDADEFNRKYHPFPPLFNHFSKSPERSEVHAFSYVKRSHLVGHS